MNAGVWGFPAGTQWWVAVAIVGWIALYPLVLSVLSIGLLRLRPSTTLADTDCPSVSVVVSARNEERDLPRCIAALLALDYPRDKLEVILINDFSTDATAQIVADAASSNPHVIALHSAERPDNGLEAKARGIAHGITVARGEWLFITDADGAVQPQWLRAMLSDAGPGVGVVGGTLVVGDVSLLAKTERMAWAFLQTFSGGLAGLGLPIACVGPNMGLRRSLYEAAGGLERADFRVAEDLALFRMAVGAGKRVRMYMDPETTVTLTPVPTASHLLSQHRRWLGGGVEHNVWYKVWVLFALWWGLGVVAFLLSGWMFNFSLWLAWVVVKVTADWLIIRAQQSRLGLERHARFLGILELYQIVFLIILPPLFLFSQRIEWLGEGYAVRYK